MAVNITFGADSTPADDLNAQVAEAKTMYLQAFNLFNKADAIVKFDEKAPVYNEAVEIMLTADKNFSESVKKSPIINTIRTKLAERAKQVEKSVQYQQPYYEAELKAKKAQADSSSNGTGGGSGPGPRTVVDNVTTTKESSPLLKYALIGGAALAAVLALS